MTETTATATNSVKDLIDLLDSKSPSVRLEAAKLLGEFRQALLDSKTEEKELFSKAIKSLFKIACSLEGEEIPETRALAMRCISNLAESEQIAEEITSAICIEDEKEENFFIKSLINSSLSAVGKHICSFPGCKTGKEATLRCSRCHLAWYCSSECAKLHWKNGNHKILCSFVSATSTKIGPIGVSCDEQGIAFLSMAILCNLSRSVKVCGKILCNSLPNLMKTCITLSNYTQTNQRCSIPAEIASDTIKNSAREQTCLTAIIGIQNQTSPISEFLNSLLLKKPNNSSANSKSSITPAAVRRSAAGVAKNICFEYSLHQRLLSSEIKIDAILLSLFRGNTKLRDGESELIHEICSELRNPLDSGYETDLETRKEALDALLLLSCKSNSRKLLIERRALYPILRDYEIWEQDETAKEIVSQIVDQLANASEGDSISPIAKPINSSPIAILPAPNSTSTTTNQNETPTPTTQKIDGIEDI